MGNRKKKEPLLYIAQPTFSKPEPFMQENYSTLTKQSNERALPVTKERPIRERHRRINPFFEIYEEGMESVDESEQDIDRQAKDVQERQENKNSEQDKRQSEDNDGKFNDLSIQGKIDYFVNLPKEMPRIKSEIELTEDVYQGYILKDTGTEIVFRTGRINETINKDDIKNIILIGF